MKDAFGKPLKVGMKVIYSTGGSAGTSYVIGEIIELIPFVPKKNVSYYPPDRVKIKPLKMNRTISFTKDPVLYSSNVVSVDSILT